MIKIFKNFLDFWEGRGDESIHNDDLPKPISLTNEPPPPSAERQSHTSINNNEELNQNMVNEPSESAGAEPEQANQHEESATNPQVDPERSDVEARSAEPNDENKTNGDGGGGSRPVTPIRINSSPVPSERLSRRNEKQGRGTSRRAAGASTNRSTTSIRQLDPYLSSINDMKYIGDQFVVGKTDPTLLSSFEQRFQRVYKPKLKESTNGLATSRSMDQSFNEFLRTKDKNTLSNPHFHSNDMKYTGDQFKVGKLDPKAVHPFEKKFQEKYKAKLKVLSPQTSPIKPLGFNELKEMHDTLSVEHQSYRLKK